MKLLYFLTENIAMQEGISFLRQASHALSIPFVRLVHLFYHHVAQCFEY